MSSLIDQQTVTVTYDTVRGEPRQRLARQEERPAGGDCVDCHQCINVCPTGVDIRDGIQLGCIQCGLCIDACDAIMQQINRPTGLIAYDTDINAERRLAGKAPIYRLIRARTVLYAAIIAGVGSIMLYTLATRGSMGVSALHERSPLFVALSDGSVRNDYTVRFLNKAGASRSFTLEALGLPALDIHAAGIERAADGKLIVEVGPDQTREVRVSLQVPAAKLPKQATDIDFKVTEIATGETASVRDHFVPAAR
jgi:cytochrome c oxidase accessory protein FixG